ncbi:MAG: tetratricopeptide repeat protein [Planctomycetes bacterium]|nr:tetratricopeptide repeat protein [Planctomycetota bacterium]
MDGERGMAPFMTNEPHDDRSATSNRRRALVPRAVDAVRRTAQSGPRSVGARIAVAGALVIAVVGLGTIRWAMQEPDGPADADGSIAGLSDTPTDLDPRVAEALQLLDEGQIDAARGLATELRMADLSFEELGGPVFVLGATIVHDAREHWNPAEQRKLYVIGSRYLEESRDRGFPEGRLAQGEFMLGESLTLGGRSAEAIPALQAALADNPSKATILHHYLAAAYLGDNPAQPDKAIPHLDAFLAEPDLSPADRLEGLLARARASLGIEDAAGCRATIGEIEALSAAAAESSEPSGTPGGKPLDGHLPRRRGPTESQRIAMALRDARIVDARCAMLEARLAERASPGSQAPFLQRAHDVLAALTAEGRETNESEYLFGVVLRAQGALAEAREQFARVARKTYDSAEGFAARLEWTELERQIGDPRASSESLVALLDEIEDPSRYANRWIDLSRLRDRVLAIHTSHYDAREFDRAARIAESMSPLFPDERATRLLADSCEQWGFDLIRRADAAPHSESLALRAEARGCFARAGEAFARLAEMRFSSRDYVDLLWRSAENHVRARAHREGIERARLYLRHATRERRSRALALLGDASLALGDTAAARAQFEQCVAAYPNAPEAYHARIGSALAAAEQGDLEQAKRFLNDNLENESLTPRSLEWRDSLFLLGELLHRDGAERLTRIHERAAKQPADEVERRAIDREFDDASRLLTAAIGRLTEAAERYSEDPRTPRSEYLIADSHYRLARRPRWKLPLETIESRRAELARGMRADLETAARRYQQLADRLDQKADSAELTPIERSAQRNCWFARAHALFEMERYSEAIDAYSTATNRYPNEPASLEAYEQIAVCYRKLGDPVKARGTREQAKIILAGMPADIDYSQTTRFTRDGWLKFLK